MSLFNSSELSRIEAKVAEVEARTAAEIVVVTVPRSDDYADVRLKFAGLIAFVGTALLHELWPELAATWLLVLMPVLGALLWPLSGLPPLLRLVLPGGRATRAAERAAELAFLEHAVFETRDRNGVLLLVSELEHRVVLLGDKALHARLADAGFVGLVEQLTAAIRAGRPADGTVELIDKLGATLAEMSPVREGDNPNELPDRVRTPG
jgi:putative membrane protein